MRISSSLFFASVLFGYLPPAAVRSCLPFPSVVTLRESRLFSSTLLSPKGKETRGECRSLPLLSLLAPLVPRSEARTTCCSATRFLNYNLWAIGLRKSKSRKNGQ